MLIMQDFQGLVLWPKHEVASITPEIGRYRVVLSDGTVAHFPGSVPAGPWQPLGHSYVNPDHLRRRPEGWLDPAEFLYPLADLLPTVPTPSEADLPGLPCKPGQIQSLTGEDGEATWQTDQGDIPAGPYAAQAAELHPDLVHAGRGAYVNRRRLRRILNERNRFRLILDSGPEFTVSYGPHERLCADLGLPQLYHLEPCLEAQYREFIRDYPRELKNAPGPWLRAEFPTPRRLIVNTMWQVIRWRKLGLPEVEEYGDEHRGFYYDPLDSPLRRAGYTAAPPLKATLDSILEMDLNSWVDLPDLRADNTHWPLFLEMVGRLVGDDALFTFQELGFADPRPDLRGLGDRLPHCLLLAEKHSLGRYTRRLAAKFGLSWLIMGGLPSLLSSEYCARALIKQGITKVKIFAYVDFDPGGWIAANSFATQLRRFGVEVEIVKFLVWPEYFSAEQLELHAAPIPMPTPQIEGKVKAWLAESGGIHGQALSIGADHLKPLPVVMQRLTQLLQEV